MSGKVFFPLRTVLGMAEVTLAAAGHSDSFSDSEDGGHTGPALMFVKDSGTYLMSNAVPRLEGNGVIYGRAFTRDGLLLRQPVDSSSASWDQVWDVSREICGGDDFAEYFVLHAGLAEQLRCAVRDGQQWLVLGVSADSISITTL